MRWSIATSLPPPALAREPEAPYGPGGDRHEPPAVELRPYTPEELWRLFRGGELEADAVEARLVRAASARCGLWLRIGQGLRALQQGRRLQELAFRFADYARELRVGRSRGYELAAFAEDLKTRPLLREAVRSGRVRYRAAQEVMPLAVGEEEARWVEKAATETVRALEREVRDQTGTGAAADEPWFRMVTGIAPEHRVVVDEALRLAGRLMPDASASGRYEAIAQEYLGEFPGEAGERCDGPAAATAWQEDARAMAAARGRVDGPLSDGQALAIIAAHFVRTYEAVAKRRLTNSQRVRERDGGWCTVPGCSAHAVDAHHIEFRSRGGHRTALWNQTSLCAFHHTCIHEFGLRLEGRAPGALRWTLYGRPFTGR